jgi:hypothetical protein
VPICILKKKKWKVDRHWWEERLQAEEKATSPGMGQQAQGRDMYLRGWKFVKEDMETGGQ